MAGTIKANTIQLGDSATATQNFVLQTNVDGTAKLARGNQGATTQDILTVDANGLVAAPGGRQFLTLGTTVASTSGTTIDFTGIPSWVKRITVMFNGVSTNGTSNLLAQVGAGSVTSSGYTGVCNMLGVTATNFSSGFMISNTVTAASVHNAQMVLVNMGSNIWAIAGQMGRTDSINSTVYQGNVALSGTLDRIRLTTVAGTDTFDAGSVNIMYEG